MGTVRQKGNSVLKGARDQVQHCILIQFAKHWACGVAQIVEHLPSSLTNILLHYYPGVMTDHS
jgi:hypothetical protein